MNGFFFIFVSMGFDLSAFVNKSIKSECSSVLLILVDKILQTK